MPDRQQRCPAEPYSAAIMPWWNLRTEVLAASRPKKARMDADVAVITPQRSWLALQHHATVEAGRQSAFFPGCSSFRLTPVQPASVASR